MKRLTLAVGTIIGLAGLAVLIVPTAVVAVANHPVSAPRLYATALIRIAVGALFLSVAADARLPWLMRSLGSFAIIAGISTLCVGTHGAVVIAAWISQQSLTVLRMFGLIPLILGALVIYGCGIVRRAV